jgi:hypothetical protein
MARGSPIFNRILSPMHHMIKKYLLCNGVATCFKPSTLLFVVEMDFSNFNSAEQAHMTKVIEKRQVNTYLSSLLIPSPRVK